MTTTATTFHIEKPRRGFYDPVRTPPFYAHICSFIKALNFNLTTDDVVFSFQPTHDLSELSNLLVSVKRRNNEQYSIDLNTLQISDAEHGSRDIPIGGTAAALKLRNYANDLLKKVQNYRDRLIKYGVITDSTPFLQVDLLTCPLCHEHFESCADCKEVVACPNGICPAAVATEGEWCDDHHPRTLCCRQCLDTKGLDAFLVRCPECQLWRYSSHLDWCFGQVVRPKEQSSLPQSESDRESMERSHPPKPSPCETCIGLGLAPKWRYCDGDRGFCPSKPRLPSRRRRHEGIPTYCTECAAGIRGRGCVCGLIWTCDVCSETLECTKPLYITCPRCRRNFCREYEGCKYCQTCRTCHKPRLCDDCLEEEAIIGLGEDQELESAVTFVERCEQCRGFICETCLPRTVNCPYCKERVCGWCTDSSHCLDCKMPMCGRCSEYMCESESLWPCPPKPGEEQESASTNQTG